MEHYRKLEKMYLNANINKNLFDSTTASISQGEASISLEITDKYFHALGAIHGSVYFKLLDDAAFFAVSSIVFDYFVLTTSFNINLLNEKKIIQQKIIMNNLKKNKAEEKTIEYKKDYLNALEKKNFS